jgi:hypothetical protein
MAKKQIDFYMLPHVAAASKYFSHSEKLIVAYLHTLFSNNRAFVGTNAYLSAKLDVQKSVISACITKLKNAGIILVTNPKSNKRKITLLHNPFTSGNFYKIHPTIAESKHLTAMEKIMISYILSYINRNKRFYATNAQIEDEVYISKEGFNTSRITFERLKWIKVKYPKSPRREIVIINKPTENMPTSVMDKVTKIMQVDQLKNNNELPKNNNELPQKDENKRSDKRIDKRSIIREDNKRSNNDEIDSTITNSFSFNTSIEETTSTKEASPEASLSPIDENNDEEATSINEEAHASTTHEVETTSTKSEAYASNSLDEEATSTEPVTSTSISNIDDGATKHISVGMNDVRKAYSAKGSLSEKEYTRLTKWVVSIGNNLNRKDMKAENADKFISSLSESDTTSMLNRAKANGF